MTYNKVLIWLLLALLANSVNARWMIARVNEDGDTLFERDTGFASDIYEVEVSEADGSIYISMHYVNIRKFDENGYYDAGFDVPEFTYTYEIDVDDENYIWVPGSRYFRSTNGLFKYTATGDYVDGLTDFVPYTVSFNGSEYVWAGDGAVGSPMNGAHKISKGVDRELYVGGYSIGQGTCDVITGDYWFRDYLGGTEWALVKLDDGGTERCDERGIGAPNDPQASPIDGGCWFISGGGLIKVDTYGSIIFRDSSFSEIAAIDVNDSDGSVWVASNIPKRLVHLDKDGNRLLYKQWPGGDFAHLAVDQRNGTCIVIYEEYKSGRSDVNIEPASVGEIKAMYAE